jgi:hypothetical protein
MKTNLWLATQPVEEPEHPEDLRQVFGVDRLGSDDLFQRLPALGFRRPHLAFKFQMTEVEKRMQFGANALGVYTFR